MTSERHGTTGQLMTAKWTEPELQRYIDDGISESLNLDYKGASTLAKNKDATKREITKDVSAMANSDGGILIYGIAEDKSVVPHMPSRIDPVEAKEISKEWLEHVIKTIQPRIDGVIIHDVHITSAPGFMAYVVEIPKSTTAHQATDHRYYKRFNFESAPMEHYEIQDVMSRRNHPKLEMQFELTELSSLVLTGVFSQRSIYKLRVSAFNAGGVYAQHVNTFVRMQKNIIADDVDKHYSEYRNGIEYVQIYTDNLAGITAGPILPGIKRPWGVVNLADCFSLEDCGDCEVSWLAIADNAPQTKGKILFRDIQLIKVSV